MLLESKTAIVYGAGGMIGAAVARAFAREGANVYLAGRSLAPLDSVAAEIEVAGGTAETAQVDALDERAVEEHASGVAGAAGSIDVTFNAISLGDVQGTPLLEMPLEDYSRPIVVGTTTHLLTARAAARHMLTQGSGVILTLSASGVRMADPVMGPPLMGGFGIACAAIEALTMNLAGEFGPHGIRVLCLRPEGMPETWREYTEEAKQSRESQGVPRAARGQDPLRRLPTLAEVANVAAFMASDQSSVMTGTVVNLTCGSIPE